MKPCYYVLYITNSYHALAAGLNSTTICKSQGLKYIANLQQVYSGYRLHDGCQYVQ